MLATRKLNWDEDRVMYFNAQGQLRSLPAEWINIDPPDVRVQAAAGRAAFRSNDLYRLAVLVEEIRSRQLKGRRRVK